MVRLIVMPANCRLLFPRMDDRQREEGCEGEGCGDDKHTRCTNRKQQFFIYFFTSTRHDGPLSAPCISLWVYVWKCLCVWEQKNSCNCESDPVSKANCDQQGVDRTVHILQAGPRASRGPRQHYCASPFIPILLFSWLSSISDPEYFGVHCEKKQHQDRMHMVNHINLTPAKSEGLDYFHLFQFTS